MKRIKRFISMLLALYLVLGMLPGTAFAADRSVSQTSSGRQTVSLNGDWTFTSYDGSSTVVQVPHSWEYTDLSSGDPAQSARTCIYERQISVGEFAGKRLFLQFDAVNKEAVVYIDGVEVGRHNGGFTAFAVDITDACMGKEQVAVRVETTNITTDTTPVNTDFSHFAGLYRDVRLVAVDPRAYLALEDSGSQGVYFSTDVDLSSGTATLTPKVMVSGQGGGEVTVQVTLKDARGCTVGSVRRTLTVSGTAQEVTLDAIVVPNAHLWQGTQDPYLYTAQTSVCVDGRTVDCNIQNVGFRTYAVRDGVFYLNGQVYTLRGVGMHQEFGAQTNATNRAQKEQDIQLVLEMGANALRTSHYPHDQYLYELCDRYGIVVWNEIPFYLVMLDTETFRENVLQNAEEMVKQGFNHPSIIVWGIENEVNYYENFTAYYSQPNAAELGQFMQELAQFVKQLDPSRLVGEAVIDSSAMAQQTAGWVTPESDTDVVGFNIYTGWYSNVNGATTENQSDRVVNSFQSKLQGYQSLFDQSSGGTVSYVMTEYGAGANIQQHADLGEDFKWGGTDSSKGYASSGAFHPEEYQSYVHEGMLMAIYGDETNGISPAENLWGAFAWAMFDFSSFRNEGGLLRLNTKGLVTADRTVKKDAFYLYKANWNDTDPFVHITSSRYTIRPDATIDVKVYSNCDAVELTVNGTSYGQGQKQQDGVFVWHDVELNGNGQGNVVTATGAKDGRTYQDVCDTWTAGYVAQITLTNTLDKTYDGMPAAEPQYRVSLSGGEIDITDDAQVTVAWYQAVAASDAPAYGAYPAYEGQPSYGGYPAYEDHPADAGPAYGEYPSYADYPSYAGYPSYGGSGAVKLVQLDGAPSEVGEYLCVLTVADGSNGTYTWLGSSLEVSFQIV